MEKKEKPVMTTTHHKLSQEFEALQIESRNFGQAQHVQVAYELLKAHSFVDATLRCANTIAAMAERAGVPEKLNTTITIAFMGLIAERMEQTPHLDFEAFAALNPDLFDKAVLARWYSHERLHSPAARAAFLLPDKIAL